VALQPSLLDSGWALCIREKQPCKLLLCTDFITRSLRLSCSADGNSGCPRTAFSRECREHGFVVLPDVLHDLIAVCQVHVITTGITAKPTHSRRMRICCRSAEPETPLSIGRLASITELKNFSPLVDGGLTDMDGNRPCCLQGKQGAWVWRSPSEFRLQFQEALLRRSSHPHCFRPWAKHTLLTIVDLDTFGQEQVSVLFNAGVSLLRHVCGTAMPLPTAHFP
jgi:hypothetical protein